MGRVALRLTCRVAPHRAIGIPQQMADPAFSVTAAHHRRRGRNHPDGTLACARNADPLSHQHHAQPAPVFALWIAILPFQKLGIIRTPSDPGAVAISVAILAEPKGGAAAIAGLQVILSAAGGLKRQERGVIAGHFQPGIGG